ncbi:hypothetical protein CKAH01_06590 [Colletotrichum kahawae]|uniref:Uncharacterized protein n=1 Tax=Colletotrichum kahawae TaxID=34407 RepID=A0AAD9Y7C0_COLKA|nr:hypothetical protein CKAH01_06590 [Colletotrichum kahawae]
MAAVVTYKPSVATITIGGLHSESEYELAATITLMPQTITFTPSADGCGIIPAGLRCYTANFTSGGSCQAEYSVESTGGSLATECFPRNYNYVWMPIGSKYRENASLVVKKGRDYPYRDCVSVLTTPTEVWVNNERTLWSSWRKIILSDFPTSAQIRVKHPVFPLDGRLPIVDNKEPEGGLSTGAVAGIVLEIVIVVLAFISSATFVVCRRKRRERRLAQTRMHTEGADTDQKGTGFDTKPELPGHDSEIRELQASSPRLAELCAQTEPSEMDASAPPVELPS